ncbi:hypothetical protein [Thioclava sp. GXIMD4216]|uniref:hypothetical protein n=1 Tax=Thioclava sp. GXIMD4216 TaxID=3131929 RepID=UPI0030D4FC21
MSLSSYLSGLLSYFFKLWLSQQNSPSAQQAGTAQPSGAVSASSQAAATQGMTSAGTMAPQSAAPTETTQIGLVVESALRGETAIPPQDSATYPKSAPALPTPPSATAQPQPPGADILPATGLGLGLSRSIAENAVTVPLDADLQDQASAVFAQMGYGTGNESRARAYAQARIVATRQENLIERLRQTAESFLPAAQSHTASNRLSQTQAAKLYEALSPIFADAFSSVARGGTQVFDAQGLVSSQLRMQL